MAQHRLIDNGLEISLGTECFRRTEHSHFSGHMLDTTVLAGTVESTNNCSRPLSRHPRSCPLCRIPYAALWGEQPVTTVRGVQSDKSKQIAYSNTKVKSSFFF